MSYFCFLCEPKKGYEEKVMKENTSVDERRKVLKAALGLSAAGIAGAALTNSRPALAASLSSAVVNVVDSTETDLKGISTGDRSNGDVVFTLGYHSINDEGGGQYQFDTSVTSGENGGTIIRPDDVSSNDGRWMLIFDGVINVKQFGAYGDGIDDKDPIQAAEDTGKSIYFPVGTYNLGSNITLTANCLFDNGAKLDPDYGVTVTMNCPISAGNYEIFDSTSAGTITSTASPLFSIPMEWWGLAIGSSAAVNTAAFLAAVAFSHNSGTKPRVQCGGGDFDVDPIVIPDLHSVFFEGAYREKTTFINSSTTADCFNFTGEHDSIVMHHFRVKANTRSTGKAIHFPAGTGDAIRDVDLNHFAYEGHDDGLFLYNVLNVHIGKLWRATGNSRISYSDAVGTGIYIATSGGGFSTDVTMLEPYISNFKRGIRSLATRVTIIRPIVENFSDYAFYAEGSGKMTIQEPSPATSSEFYDTSENNLTNLYRRDAAAYMHVYTTRDGFGPHLTPFNVGTNGRFKYEKDKLDNVIAFRNTDVEVNSETPNYADIDDWTLMTFDRDIAADTPSRDYAQDTESNYDTSTYQYTAPAPGKYKLTFQATIDIQNNGKYVIAIFKGSTTTGKICETWFREKAADSFQNYITLRTGATIYLNHLDTVEVRVWQDSKVSQNVIGSKGIYNHAKEGEEGEEGEEGTNTADPSHLSFFEIVALG